MRKRLGTLGVLVLTGLALGACDFFVASPEPTPTLIDAPPAYLDQPMAKAERGRVEEAIHMVGRVEAEVRENLFFKVDGRIEAVHVRVGDAVKAGDVLAELDTGGLDELIAEAQRVLQLAVQRVRGAESTLADQRAAAEQTYLLAQNEVAARQRELDELLAGRSEAELAAARAAVDSASAVRLERQATVTRLETGLPDLIAAAEAKVALCEAELAAAQQKADDLRAGRVWGDQQAQAAADVALAQAQLALSEARQELTLAQSPGGPPALQEARHALAVAEVELAAVTATLEALERGPAEAEIEAVRNLLQAATIRRDNAQRLLDDIDSETSATSLDLTMLRLAAEEDQARLDELLAQVFDHQIVAPFDGVVSYVGNEPGHLVREFRDVLQVADPSRLVVEAPVERSDIRRLSVGQEVEVTVDGLPGVVFKGEVVAGPREIIGSTGETISIQNATITVDWDRPGIEIGMRAECKITLQVKEDVLKVPVSAVHFVRERGFVEILVDGRRRSLLVTTGIQGGGEIEIVDGLDEGSMVFVSP